MLDQKPKYEDESAFVEYAPKKVQFTVNHIEDINVYRAQQKASEAKWEAEWLKKQAVRRETVANLVANQSAELNLSDLEKEELKYRQTRDDDNTYVTPEERYKLLKHTPGKWDSENLNARPVLAGFDQIENDPYFPKGDEYISRKKFKAQLVKVMKEQFKSQLEKVMKYGFGW
jgi:hypothetical protein